MRDSTKNRILKRIRGKGRGTVFLTKDVLDLGARGSVDQALSRLARDGTIRRLAQGVYDYPKIHDRLGPLTPSTDAVADALARKTGSNRYVSGARAANALGLSTQVPAKSVYLTDGSSRKVRMKIGNQVIHFRHASPNKLAKSDAPGWTVLLALRYLGPDGVIDDVIDRLRDSLSPRDKRGLRDLSNLAPIWAHSAIDQIATEGAT